MKLYCVFGIEYHVGKELLGIYDSLELASKRVNDVNTDFYDEVVIKEIELNKDIYESSCNNNNI